MKEISIIIVNFNSKELVRKCLLSIYTSTKNISYEIIIIDNNSDDDSVEMFQKEFPEILLIRNSTNIGFGSAVNLGIKQSDAEYIFLLNPDTFLLNNVLKIFYDYFESKGNGNVWCCGANVFDQNYANTASFGNYTSIGRIFFEQTGLNQIFKKYFFKKYLEFPQICNDQPFTVPFVLGADMFIRRCVLEEIGVFDEDFDLNYEEAELSFRAAKSGYYSILVPEAKIIHYGGQSYKSKELQWLHHRRGEILFAKKCFSSYKYFIILIIYLLGTLIRLMIKNDGYELILLKYILRRKQKSINQLTSVL